MIRFNPKQCLNCLCCMSIEKCRDYINTKRHGEPYFKKEPDCNKCNECIDICGKALSKIE